MELGGGDPVEGARGLRERVAVGGTRPLCPLRGQRRTLQPSRRAPLFRRRRRVERSEHRPVCGPAERTIPRKPLPPHVREESPSSTSDDDSRISRDRLLGRERGEDRVHRRGAGRRPTAEGRREGDGVRADADIHLRNLVPSVERRRETWSDLPDPDFETPADRHRVLARETVAGGSVSGWGGRGGGRPSQRRAGGCSRRHGRWLAVVADREIRHYHEPDADLPLHAPEPRWFAEMRAVGSRSGCSGERRGAGRPGGEIRP